MCEPDKLSLEASQDCIKTQKQRQSPGSSGAFHSERPSRPLSRSEAHWGKGLALPLQFGGKGSWVTLGEYPADAIEVLLAHAELNLLRRAYYHANYFEDPRGHDAGVGGQARNL